MALVACIICFEEPLLALFPPEILLLHNKRTIQVDVRYFAFCSSEYEETEVTDLCKHEFIVFG